MPSPSQVDILLRTIGDASGADKINAALGIVQKSEKELQAQRALFLSAAQAETAEVNRLVEASKRAAAARALEAKAAADQTRAAQQATQETKLNADAMQRLEEAAQRTQKFFTLQAVNPWATASAGARVNVNQLHEAQDKAAGSSRNMSNALLQASRGLQDMQYGLAGAVNNLEGIASALGLGAGVAGVVTVLAVAVQQLGPHVITWLKSLDTEGSKLTELKATLERAGAAIKGDYSSNVANASRISEAFTEHLKKERDELEANDRALDSNVRLLKMRADLQKSENQRRLESDIEDIKAQKLPPEQEKAAIATRKREELDANKKLADDAASAGISAESDKVVAQQKRRDELKQQEQALKKEHAASVEHAALMAEQAGLNGKPGLIDKAKAAEDNLNNTATLEDPEAYAKAREQANKAKAALEASKARAKEIQNNAPGQQIRKAEVIKNELDQVTPQAKEAEDQARKNLEALDAKIKEETQAQEFRDKEYKRNLDKIAREQTGGVYDQGNLNAPPAGLPGSPAPLGPPAAPGTTLPAPSPGFGPAELNPPRVPSTAPGPTFGPQPNAPESAPASEKGSEKISAAAKKNADAFDRAAQMVEKLAEQTDKRLKAMEQKIRSQGVMA